MSYGEVQHITKLALHWLDAVVEDYERKIRDMTLHQRKIADRAITLAGDQAWVICASAVQPAIYATISSRRKLQDPYFPQRHVPVIQHMLGDAKPLWVHYWNEAMCEIDDEAGMSAGV